MNRFVGLLIFLVFCSCSPVIMANEGTYSSGDSTSNALQEQVDKGSLSPSQAQKAIDNDNFDAADGGLYCPDNQCESDPDDAANGF